MSVRAKISLSVLIAIFLGGTGYFFIVNKSQPEVLPPINTSPKTEEIDTSDWQTYYSGPKGFEIKIPPDWSKRDDHDGPQQKLENEFWRIQVGVVSFTSSRLPSAQFSVLIKDSNLTLEEFTKRVGFGKEENNLINNFQAIKYFLDGRKDKQPNYREALLVKNNSRYYYFEFSASDDNIDNDIAVWNQIISTFKSLD